MSLSRPGSMMWPNSPTREAHVATVPSRSFGGRPDDRPPLADAAIDKDRRRVEENLRFLAAASATLIDVTDVEATLTRIANLAVPDFADWSEVAVREGDGSLRRVAMSHGDPGRLAVARELHRRYPAREREGAMLVVETGEPLWIPRVEDAMLEQVSRDAEHLRLMRSLNLHSYIAAPIRCRDRILGALVFATAESGRAYSEFDLYVAEELGRRAATALLNAEMLQGLKDADRRKDDFLAVLAHELRNPLAPVRNALEILRATQTPSPQLQWTYDLIDRQVRQMARLVDDLLDVSRIASGKLELRKERIELGAAVRLAVEASRPLIERSGHDLSVQLPEEPLWLEADLARLSQIISNLLNNAAKYTAPGGRIWLNARRTDGHLVIEVGDNGAGIPADKIGSIFEMYSQVGAGNDRTQGGLGIGLALVKRLTELHEGTVEARSDGAGRGSTFLVKLPVPSRAPQRVSGDGALGREQRGKRRRRVLVVDDNLDAADSLAMLLTTHGHELRTGYDGEEAVQIALAFQPDVVLMDIGLPKMHGLEAGKRIRAARGSDVTLIAITGWGQEEDRRRSQQAGFDYHLTKPVDGEAIARLIDETAPAKRASETG